MAQALYRRYRPESFADVIGQDHVTTPLKRALRSGRVGHAYLFSGPRGCGKTTSARILARCLNCAEGPTDEPCGVCDSCRDLARDGAGSLDVVEIDAASHGGVDDARELRERATFAPARDRFKVFIIDEAHMVTSAGFNALLKLVEEPPEHVKFIFATTEPDKVIGTIRSRTHHYPFRLIPPQVLTPYLERVCAEEGVSVGEGVLPLVVRAGGGSARDTMSVLDQLMAGSDESGLDYGTAINLLGFTDTALLDEAITAVSARNAESLYAAVERVLETGHEPRRFVEDLLERVRDLIILAAVPDRGAELLPQVPAGELERMQQQASTFVPADLSHVGDLIHETLSTMSGATSPRLHLELLAARLVLRDQRGGGGASSPVQQVSAPQGGQRPSQDGGPQQGAGTAQRPTALGRQDADQSQGAPPQGGGREQARLIAQQQAEAARRARNGRSELREAQQGSQGPESTPAQRPGQEHAETSREAGPRISAQEQAAPQDQSAPQEQRASREQGAVHEQVSPEQVPAQQTPVQSSAPAGEPAADAQSAEAPARYERSEQSAPSAAGAPVSADQVRAQWPAIVEELQQIRRPAWALVNQNAHVHGVAGQTLFIGFGTQGLVNAFYRGTNAQNTAEAVQRVTGAPLAVEAVVGEDPQHGNGPATPPSAGGPAGGAPAQGGPETEGAGRGGAPGAAPPRGPVAGGPGPEGPGASHAGQTGGQQRAEAPPQAPQPSQAPQPPQRSQAVPPSAPPAGAEDYREYRDEDIPPDDDYYPYEEAVHSAPASSQPPARPAPKVQSRWGDAAGPAAASPRASEQPAPDAPATRGAAAVRAALRGEAPPADADEEPAVQEVRSADPPTAPLQQPPTAAEEIPVVEDEGRDQLPPDQPRTHGQAALRRALDEDRVVRSRPAASAAPEADSAVPAASSAPIASPASAPPAQPAAAAQQAPSAPSASGAPGGGGEVHGAALAREAFRASRDQAQQHGGPRRGGPGTGQHSSNGQDARAADDDPTGGASRDDADADFTARSGQQLVESLLGGKVLEVIDESGY